MKEVDQTNNPDFIILEDSMWGTEAQDILDTDIDDVVDRYLDQSDEQICGTWHIQVYEYKRKIVFWSWKGVLGGLIEDLDCNYGSLEECTMASDNMREAAMKFVDCVVNEYVPWQCEKTGNYILVDAVEWCKKNQPDWLN